MKALKSHVYDIIIVVIFALISFAYFYPVAIDGKILYHHDHSASKGLGKEVAQYKEQTGEVSRWTNSLFGGMPTYQSSPSYESQQGVNALVKAYHLWMPENVWFVFVYLLGFYILLRAFNFREWMAALGAIVWAFSSYFFIIIAAGHIWKVMALAYLPPMIAGIVLAYRGKYLAGLIVTSIFAAFEINANHVQMTYYFMFVIIAMVIAFIIDAAREKRWSHIAKATGVCVMAAIIALMLNISNLYHTWEYQKETMRGKSELVKKNASNQTANGLDRDYITQWSYGIDETWTLLLPNAMGGASFPLSMNETAMEHSDPQYEQFYSIYRQYWGEQPGTSGPVYIGAFVVMLFVLGLFIVKGPMKWALLFATILSILLSWGKNFMGLTDFFLDYVPMYAKFRTVASILVIAEFTMPLLGMMALKKIVDDPDALGAKHKWLWISTGITAGVCLLFAIAPGIFSNSFLSIHNDGSVDNYLIAHYGQQGIDANLLASVKATIVPMRKAMFVADAWRSFFIILIGTGLVLLYKRNTLKSNYMLGGLIVLCLVDMWQVNKRYLNNDMFVDAIERDAPQEKTKTDEIILADTTDCGNYRVLNLASDTFNENETSYYHKSIGGYHPAKLQRYQDLIDHYIHPEMRKSMQAAAEMSGDLQQVNGDSIMPVLDMLNTRYLIMPLQSGEVLPLKNPHAMGNAWFVNKVQLVENANQEIEALGKINLHETAVADNKFDKALQCKLGGEVNGTVKITNYAPNHLTYTAETNQEAVLVFSEIYYPGWTALVDGKPVDVARVNYILRAIVVPQGKHKIELMFYPESISVTETIAYCGYGILLLALIATITLQIRKKKQEHKQV